MVRQYRTVPFWKAVSNNNIRAMIAVVSQEAIALSRIQFQPHLVLAMIAKNKTCVLWFVEFLRGLLNARREKLFKCTYKKCGYFKMMRDAGIPRLWLTPGTFTQRQLDYLVRIGYDESYDKSPYDDITWITYVNPTLPDVTPDISIPTSLGSARGSSDTSPPVTPGPESGIEVLSNVLTSKEFESKQPVFVNVRPHKAEGDQCCIM